MANRSDPEERLYLEERLREQYGLKEKREYFNMLSPDELRRLRADYERAAQNGAIDPIYHRLLLVEIDRAYWGSH